MYKLIIIDDEERIRRGLRRCVDWGRMGVEVVGEAGNGKEALPLIMNLKPDLIITDIRMPDMDGLHLVEAVRALNIPAMIIIISGYNDFTYAQQAIRHGVCDYLLKPIEEAELCSRVLACIARLQEPAKKAADTQAARQAGEMSNPIIREALVYMDTHYSEDIGLSDVAGAVCVHPNYLSALFTRETGERFNESLNRLRIAKAKELMRQPYLKIYEVAELVGYSDYRWFSKIFKSMEGVTPVKYKRHQELEC